MQVRTPNPIRDLAEACADDFPRFCFEGFGVMLSEQQEEFVREINGWGPRVRIDEPKFSFLSGGTRSGKTVLLALGHADACLYKRGVDPGDTRYWNNYLYKTLGCAPTGELSLKLWQVMDELSKGASDAQFDRSRRVSRPGRFLHLFKAGKAGDNPVVRFENGARTDFRSTEGYAFRLEGDQWWLFTWDEWASQPDREIDFIKDDVLLSRSRDHDAKIIPAAWPKAATERHLITQMRRVEAGAQDTRIFFMSSMDAHFTNQTALEVEKRVKSKASFKRTVLGRPAGGASVEFKEDVIANATNRDLRVPWLPADDGENRVNFMWFNSWDLGLAHDSTVGGAWRIPRAGVDVFHKARLCNTMEIKGSDDQTLDHIAAGVKTFQSIYPGRSAVDASGLGGVAAVRQLKTMNPRPLAFVAKSQHRIWGNMRLAAITNAIDMLTWGRPAGTEEEPDDGRPWGLVEIPYIAELNDQLANFDRDAKNVPDDWVWMMLIGLWYIRRYWVTGDPPGKAVRFSPHKPVAPERQRRKAVPFRRRR